jgi:hypothetical protein
MVNNTSKLAPPDVMTEIRAAVRLANGGHSPSKYQNQILRKDQRTDLMLWSQEQELRALANAILTVLGSTAAKELAA